MSAGSSRPGSRCVRANVRQVKNEACCNGDLLLQLPSLHGCYSSVRLMVNCVLIRKGEETEHSDSRTRKLPLKAKKKLPANTRNTPIVPLCGLPCLLLFGALNDMIGSYFEHCLRVMCLVQGFLTDSGAKKMRPHLPLVRVYPTNPLREGVGGRVVSDLNHFMKFHIVISFFLSFCFPVLLFFMLFSSSCCSPRGC